jgi:hypothetical protein
MEGMDKGRSEGPRAPHSPWLGARSERGALRWPLEMDALRRSGLFDLIFLLRLLSCILQEVGESIGGGGAEYSTV